jgi:hypothetical protein
MTGHGHRVVTVTLPAESFTLLFHPFWIGERQRYVCPHCTAASPDQTITHDYGCLVPEIWAWAETTSSLTAEPTPEQLAKVARELEGLAESPVKD